MTKQEMKECFQEVMNQALGEIKNQTECYKDLINQQSLTNQNILKQQTDSFKSIIGEFLTSINNSVDTKCNAVSNDVMGLAKEIETLKQERTQLLSRISALETALGTTRADLDKVQDDVDEVEAYSRRSCLIFSNLPSEGNKSDEELVLDMMNNKLELADANSSWIDNAHRLGKPEEGTTSIRKMIVKFSSGKYREAVWRSKGKLKTTNIIMTEQLTKKRSVLLKKCIDEISGEKWVFTNNGNVLVRIGEDLPIHIKNIKHLENVKNRGS